MIAVCFVAALAFCAWALKLVLVHQQMRHDAYMRESQASMELERERLKLDREKWEAERAVKQTPKRPEPMPADLVGRIAQWEDDWAREDEERYIKGLYADLGNWDAVRRAVRAESPEGASL